MKKEIIALTTDEMRAGMMITDRGSQLQAALQAVAALEVEYVEQLRAKYGLDGEWTVSQWLNGLERITEAESSNGE